MDAATSAMQTMIKMEPIRIELPAARQCSRESPTSNIAGAFRTRKRRRLWRSGRRLDHLGGFIDDFAYLRFGNDERRGEDKRFARDPQHQVFVEEGALQRLIGPLADGIGLGGKVDRG